MSATVARLYRYPVKGLGAEPLAHADVARGAGMPNDRRWAIAPGRTTYDDAHPVWMRKEAFVMLMRDGDERLATLRCAFEDDGAVLVATPPSGRPGARTCARRMVGATQPPRSPPSSVRVPTARCASSRPGSLSLTDIPQNGLSVINLASVDDFARRIGRPVDPLRFRANVYVAGLPAWAERAWIGRRIAIGSRGEPHSIYSDRRTKPLPVLDIDRLPGLSAWFVTEARSRLSTIICGNFTVATPSRGSVLEFVFRPCCS